MLNGCSENNDNAHLLNIAKDWDCQKRMRTDFTEIVTEISARWLSFNAFFYNSIMFIALIKVINISFVSVFLKEINCNVNSLGHRFGQLVFMLGMEVWSVQYYVIRSRKKIFHTDLGYRIGEYECFMFRITWCKAN